MSFLMDDEEEEEDGERGCCWWGNCSDCMCSLVFMPARLRLNAETCDRFGVGIFRTFILGRDVDDGDDIGDIGGDMIGDTDADEGPDAAAEIPVSPTAVAPLVADVVGVLAGLRMYNSQPVRVRLWLFKLAF